MKKMSHAEAVARITGLIEEGYVESVDGVAYDTEEGRQQISALAEMYLRHSRRRVIRAIAFAICGMVTVAIIIAVIVT